MGEAPRIHDARNRVPILAQLSDWLKVIGLIILVGEAILVTMVMTSDKDDPLRAFYFGGAVFLLLVVVGGLITDRYLQHKRKIRLDSIAGAGEISYSTPLRIDDEAIAAVLDRMKKCVSAALIIKHPVFRKAIRLKLERSLEDFSDWQHGQFYVGPDDSTEVLVDLYRTAKDSVFSTSIKDFAPQSMALR